MRILRNSYSIYYRIHVVNEAYYDILIQTCKFFILHRCWYKYYGIQTVLNHVTLNIHI